MVLRAPGIVRCIHLGDRRLIVRANTTHYLSPAVLSRADLLSIILLN